MNDTRDGSEGMRETAMDPQFRASLRRMLVAHARDDTAAMPARRTNGRSRLAAMGLATAAVAGAIAVGTGIAGLPEQRAPVALPTPPATATVEVHCVSGAVLSDVVPQSATGSPAHITRILSSAPIVHVEASGLVVTESDLRAACATAEESAEDGALSEAGPQSSAAPDLADVGEIGVEFQASSRGTDAGVCVSDGALIVLPGGISCARFGLEPLAAAPTRSEEAE
ncbi:hypothetical protein JOD62_000481 [Microbacterium keratanolyticum]|uniref:Uncharacterized protein n=1 Tax=Microbacterium keratanolyticum TaxID=67574 RepID=A0A9W6HUM5_9MICO|nr:hypothetical protein [Microbacterium keratanolyticum]MBM7467933.1 hypothetical protein [Microbacterium keratanolyticum]GLK02924.1 hypothetical protein GCM10017596_26390 [Microbacterium keratanolyticum]